MYNMCDEFVFIKDIALLWSKRVNLWCIDSYTDGDYQEIIDVHDNRTTVLFKITRFLKTILFFDIINYI